jgi:hypothetical protein
MIELSLENGEGVEARGVSLCLSSVLSLVTWRQTVLFVLGFLSKVVCISVRRVGTSAKMPSKMNIGEALLFYFSRTRHIQP